MGLLESTLLSVCVSTSGMANQACSNAITAGGKQSGVFEMYDKYEDRKVHNLQDGAVSYLGKSTTEVIGGVGWLAKSIADRKASIGLPNFGIASSIVAQIGQDKSLLLFRWTF